MIEMLKIIVLACNIGTSYEIQTKCRAKLIECMESKSGMREWFRKDLAACLKVNNAK